MAVYSQKKHYVLNNSQTELGRWLDREFPKVRGLFVYFHLSSRNWVIARWTSRIKSLFDDVVNIGNLGPLMGPAKAYLLRERLLTINDHKGIIEDMNMKEYRENRFLTDESMIDSEKRKPRKVQVLGG